MVLFFFFFFKSLKFEQIFVYTRILSVALNNNKNNFDDLLHILQLNSIGK